MGADWGASRRNGRLSVDTSCTVNVYSSRRFPSDFVKITTLVTLLISIIHCHNEVNLTDEYCCILRSYCSVFDFFSLYTWFGFCLLYVFSFHFFILIVR